MAKRQSSAHTLQFALELLKRIPRERDVTAEQLLQQLRDAGIERDIRTVQRQLEELTEQFDIEQRTESKPYGYRWKKHSGGLSIPLLTPQESLLLTLAQQRLKAIMPARVMSSLKEYFDQAKSKLSPVGNARKERDWLRKVRVVATTQPLLAPKIQADVFEAVSDALYNDVWLEIEYVNAGGKRSATRVMPLGIAQQGPMIYLVCRFKGYADDRNLALHRLHSARSTGMTFERPSDFDLEKYDGDGKFGFGEGKRIKLKILIDADAGHHLTESPLSSDQTIFKREQELEIGATVTESAHLVNWLMGFSDSVQVLEPKSLRRRIAQKHSLALRRYASNVAASDRNGS